MLRGFSFKQQLDEKDCGATCLYMIARYYNQELSIDELRTKSFTSTSGASFYGLGKAINNYGFESEAYQCEFEDLIDLNSPVICHWQQNHFIVLIGIKGDKVYIADPAIGKYVCSRKEFIQNFYGTNDHGLILTIHPTNEIGYHNDKTRQFHLLTTLFDYISEFKGLWRQILIASIFTSIIGILLPLISQSIIDDGIFTKDLKLVFILIFCQIVLFIGRLSFDIIKNWLVIHLNFRIGVTLISNFLSNFLGLTGYQLKNKNSADLVQRIEDTRHIDYFLASASFHLIPSVITVLIFAFLLLFYSIKILVIFLIGTALGVLWILFFQPKRAIIYNRIIGVMTSNRAKIINLINGMMEIKLHGIERQKRYELEEVQLDEYTMQLQSLKIEQIQGVGYMAIGELKNLVILLIGALAVMNGSITIGGLLVIIFITGQISSSLNFLPDFFHQLQEAKISLERLQAVSENGIENSNVLTFTTGDISLENISFTYDGYKNVLSEINLTIPYGQTTAIVGSSGSGKTTLLHLLTKFIRQQEGSIYVENKNIEELDDRSWRNKIGVVLQDGHIFSDTIENNICVNEEMYSESRVRFCAEMANLNDEIESWPNGYETLIGDGGRQLSKGQHQRVQIARAIYNDPEYLLLDEASSALDTINEKIIHQNLAEHFGAMTRIIVAHRLSTVKNADQIVTMEDGRIVEVGTHEDLLLKRGRYYELINDQLPVS